MSGWVHVCEWVGACMCVCTRLSLRKGGCEISSKILFHVLVFFCPTQIYMKIYQSETLPEPKSMLEVYTCTRVTCVCMVCVTLSIPRRLRQKLTT